MSRICIWIRPLTVQRLIPKTDLVWSLNDSSHHHEVPPDSISQIILKIMHWKKPERVLQHFKPPRVSHLLPARVASWCKSLLSQRRTLEKAGTSGWVASSLENFFASPCSPSGERGHSLSVVGLRYSISYWPEDAISTLRAQLLWRLAPCQHRYEDR